MMNDGFSVKRLTIQKVFAVPRQVINECLYLTAGYLVYPDMPECGINPLCHPSEPLYRGFLEIDNCIFVKPFLCKLGSEKTTV